MNYRFEFDPTRFWKRAPCRRLRLLGRNAFGPDGSEDGVTVPGKPAAHDLMGYFGV